MIASLRGRLLSKQAGRVIIDVGGVGYAVHIPFSTFFLLGDADAPVSLLVHTHVRDDAIVLYGFASEIELALFERLIAVTGIGPKLATTILSGIPAADLAGSIRDGEIRRLTSVPGVGKKTAERLVLELRDKLDNLPGESSRTQPQGSDATREDAISALVNLGWSRRDAESALARLEPTGIDLETLLKQALALLAR